MYSGKGGVCNNGYQSSSIYLLIKVSGLIRLLLYFSSQQLIKASVIAMEVLVYTKTVFSKSELLFWVAILQIPIQWAPGVIFLEANIKCPLLTTTKGLQSQNWAIATSSESFPFFIISFVKL